MRGCWPATHLQWCRPRRRSGALARARCWGAAPSPSAALLLPRCLTAAAPAAAYRRLAAGRQTAPQPPPPPAPAQVPLPSSVEGGSCSSCPPRSVSAPAGQSPAQLCQDTERKSRRGRRGRRSRSRRRRRRRRSRRRKRVFRVFFGAFYSYSLLPFFITLLHSHSLSLYLSQSLYLSLSLPLSLSFSFSLSLPGPCFCFSRFGCHSLLVQLLLLLLLAFCRYSANFESAGHVTQWPAAV